MIKRTTALPATPYFRIGHSIYNVNHRYYEDRKGKAYRADQINFFVVEVEFDGARKQRFNFDDFGHFIRWSAEAANRGHNITDSTILPDLRCAAGNI